METKSTIKALFSASDRKISVPVYQRAYSWEVEQLEQFMDDLESARDRYYLGHFLFEEFNHGELYVIDGQQRLTTCVIFFSALYEELLLRGYENKAGVDDLKNCYLRDRRKNTQRFSTVEYDNNYFADYILDFTNKSNSKTTTHSQERIRFAQEFIRKFIKPRPTEKLIYLKDVLEKATITQFIVENKSEAAEIFAFQNDRGKKLSKLDVLKSYFMLQIYLSESGNEAIEESIRYIESEFSLMYKNMMFINLDEDRVLDYYWRSISSKGFHSDESVNEIKKHIKDNNKDKVAFIKEFTRNLSISFRIVHEIENSTDISIRYLFNLNNMALSYPFLIKAGINNITEKTKSRLASLLENLTFRHLLCGGRAIIESRLNQYLCKNCTTDLEFEDLINDIIEALKCDGHNWKYWNDQAMETQLDSSSFYGNRVDNYFLWRYEMYISDPEHPYPPFISFDQLISNESIEHIAPQTPTDGAPMENGYGSYKAEPAENGIESGGWLNCVGNLVLISQKHNSQIGNKAFNLKLKSYGVSNLLNQQKEIKEFVEDVQNPVWDKNAIARRHNKMLEVAKKLWSLDSI